MKMTVRRGAVAGTAAALVVAGTVAATAHSALASPGQDRFAAPDTAAKVSTRFDLEGHRGTRGLRPEDTLPAFSKALDIGVRTLELDTGVTKDGVVVISHDSYSPRRSAPTPGRSPRTTRATPTSASTSTT